MKLYARKYSITVAQSDVVSANQDYITDMYGTRHKIKVMAMQGGQAICREFYFWERWYYKARGLMR